MRRLMTKKDKHKLLSYHSSFHKIVNTYLPVTLKEEGELAAPVPHHPSQAL